MADKLIHIGGRLHSDATGNIVTGANEVLDDDKGKKQSVINAENDAHFENLDSHATDTDNDIESLDNRIHAVEEHESIMIEGGNLEVVNTGEDIQPGSGAVATANALANNYGYLVDNPEWIYVLLDSQKRILAGIKSDGSVEWAIGVPTPVKTYIANAIAEIKNGTEGTDLDGLNKIIAFLSELSTSDTLKDLLDSKVDKEEGKSLIDAEYANGVHYIENPEFIEVKLDADDKILEATMLDGTKLLPAGVKVIGTAEYDGATVKTVENPEFAGIWLDTDEKILFGVEQNGNFLFGCGVPRQVKEYIEQKIEELSLDEYESIVTFIGDYLNNTTLEELLSKKVDGEYVENPEYIDAKVDNEDKILEATEKDGTKLFGGNVKILGSIDISGLNYKVVSNPEWLEVVLDSEDRIICGIKTNGKFVVYIADFLDDIEAIKARLEELDAYSVAENPEFMDVELDANDKVLSGRKVDGTKFENNDVELNGNATVGGSLEVDGVVIKNIEDQEGRHEITLDSEEKIISYRKDDGTLVENVGIETPSVSTDSLNLSESGMTEFQQALKDSGFKPASIDIKYNLPKYGTVNIKQETFYLSQGNYTDKNDLEVRQELPDTDENAAAGLTIAHYYIKNTNTKLDFYAAGKVTKVEDKYYVISSLEDGHVVPSSIEVTQIIDKPDVRTWPVDKKTEHYCLVDIDFEHYLTKSDIPVGVKFQGASTLYNRKRNFRFTFYKSSAKPYYPIGDDKFGKKDKVKIGELLRLSGFNLKSNWTDNSRVKELILYRIFIEVWKSRPDTDRFPWDKEFGFYTGATGIINGFQIKTLVGGDFYGIQTFGLKKDEKNYMLDGDDSSGMFVSGTRRDATCWTTATASDWEDEMMDEMSQSTADALNTFFAFINNRLEVDGNIVEFNKENIPERMDVLGWIDYFINMQLFVMHDSICRNMILHTRSDKKKFYPYFYDVDLTLRRGGFDADIFDEAYDIRGGQKVMNDMSLWENFVGLYWDEIVNRYCYLRKTILNIDYFTAMYHASADAIPDADYSMENQRWGVNTSKVVFEELLNLLDKRLVYLDENYFIV